ncbi:MAG: DUF1559 domain-containing protein [Planctomyces sp.]|nr:DUF1559 domain-containing protein [Planctomyces sp.]
MARRRSGVWLGFLAVSACLGGLVWNVAAQQRTAESPAAALLPSGSVLYLGIDGGLQHQAAFEKTAAYDAVFGSGLMDGLKKAADRLRAQATEAGADEAALAMGADIAMHVLDHGVSLGVAIEMNAQGPPIAFGVLVLPNASKFLPTIEQSIRAASRGEIDFLTRTRDGRSVTSGMIPDSPGVDFGWWVEGGQHVVFAIGMNGVESALQVATGAAPNITQNKMYQKYTGAQSFEQNAAGFVDVAALRTMFGGMPLPPNRGGRTVTINELLVALGLQNLNAVAMQSGYKDRACWSEVAVEAPGPRTGLLSLLDQPTFTIDSLPKLPPRLLSLTAMSFDGAKTYDTIMGIVKNVTALNDPSDFDDVNQGLAQAERELGFRIRDDLLASLKGVGCLYVDGGGSQSFDAIGAAMAIQDGARLKSSLQKVFDIVSEASRGEVTFEKSTKFNRDLHVMRIRQAPIVAPTLCIDKDWLYVGVMPQAIDSALLRLDGRLPSWTPGEEHLAALAELPKTMTTLSIGDTQTTYRQLLSAAPMLIGLVNTAMAQNTESGFEFPLKPEDLPPAELVAQPLFPNISVSTVDDSGSKGYSRTSLPGLDLGSSAAVTAVGVALLLPAVQQAREAARRAQSNNNLKQIGLALHNYHDTFGFFPAGTVANADLEPEERLSWMYSILPYLDQAPLFNNIRSKESWDSAANTPSIERLIPTYLHPSSPEPTTHEGRGATHYVGLAGIGEDGPTLAATDKGAGFFAYNRATRIAQITDGTSNTVMVAESDGQARPWAEGGPSTIRPLTQQPYINGPDGIGGISQGGANMLFADGSVRFVSEQIDSKVMEALTTIAGGEAVGNF